MTFDGIVGVERIETHVAVGIGGTFEVGKGKGVALRCRGVVGDRLGNSVNDDVSRMEGICYLRKIDRSLRRHSQCLWMGLGRIHLVVESKDR